jgi:hypothetical protein
MTQISSKRLRYRARRPWRECINSSPLIAAVNSIIIVGFISLHIFRYDASPDASFMPIFRNELIQRQKTRRFLNLRELPNHCDQPEFKEIIIKGERHCGTNLVRSILANNVKEGILVDQTSTDIGWKHGYLPPEGWGRPIEQDDLLIVITRDVFTWLPKIYKETYDKTFNRKIHHSKFPAFIEEPYTASCQPQYHQNEFHSVFQNKFCSSLVKDKTWFGVDQDAIIAERAMNVVQIRSEKYKQWLSQEPGEEAYRGEKVDFLAKRVHIRYEDLTDAKYGKDVKERQQNVVGEQLWKLCVPIYKTFTETKEKLKWQKHTDANAKPFDSKKEKQKMLKYYSKEELRFVLSQLDMEFEKKLGYNYDYVHELLNSDSVPEKPIARPPRNKRARQKVISATENLFQRLVAQRGEAKNVGHR